MSHRVGPLSGCPAERDAARDLGLTSARGTLRVRIGPLSSYSADERDAARDLLLDRFASGNISANHNRSVGYYPRYSSSNRTAPACFTHRVGSVGCYLSLLYQQLYRPCSLHSTHRAGSAGHYLATQFATKPPLLASMLVFSNQMGLTGRLSRLTYLATLSATVPFLLPPLPAD